MVVAPRMKLADKQEIYKKLLAGLKKRYPSIAKLPELPVLETMIFAVCLENATVSQADAAYKRLLASFHDLNEVRVSSIDELEGVFEGMSEPDWRASRIKGILSYVFETTYSFEYDSLKRKTLELATKQLAKIKELTPFVRDYTLHSALGAHLIPTDQAIMTALEFLDLQAETGGVEATAESLRPLVRKAEGAEFTGLLREFSLDAKLKSYFALIKQASQENSILPHPLIRLEKLMKGEPIKLEKGAKKSPDAKLDLKVVAKSDKKETEKKDDEKKVAEKKDVEKKELDKKLSEKKDSEKKDSEKKDSEKKGQDKKESLKKETEKVPSPDVVTASKPDKKSATSAESKSGASKSPKVSETKSEFKVQESKSPDSKNTDGKLLEAKLSDKPIADKPVGDKPAKSSKTESSKTESSKTDVLKADAGKSETLKSEGSKTKQAAEPKKEAKSAAPKKGESADEKVSGKKPTAQSSSKPAKKATPKSGK